MRIVSRDEFLKLPSGTLYANIGKREYGINGELYIKYATLEEDDWVYASLVDVEMCYGDDRWYFLDKAYKDSSYEIPLDTYATCRDGRHDGNERVFLVFSKKEVKQLITLLVEETL